MAKKTAAVKKKTPPAAPAPKEADMKLVRLELTPEQHQRFRVAAAKKGLPMALMARQLVEEWLAGQE